MTQGRPRALATVSVFSPFQFSRLVVCLFSLRLSVLHSFLHCFFLAFSQENFGKGTSAGFQLFGSPHGKDLVFTDATRGFLRVPPKMDARLYLGYKYFAATQHLRRGV